MGRLGDILDEIEANADNLVDDPKSSALGLELEDEDEAEDEDE